VYGQEVVLPIEVNLGAYRMAKQNDLDAVVYHDLMMDNIGKITDKRMRALKEIEKDKARVARATTRR
jgi:FMN-dependent NADH-azoreductase